MPTGDVETVSIDGMWTNQVEGQAQDERDWFQTKEKAQEAGRDLAKALGVEHIVKNLDGTIGERSSYGHDPRDVPG